MPKATVKDNKKRIGSSGTWSRAIVLSLDEVKMRLRRVMEEKSWPSQNYGADGMTSMARNMSDPCSFDSQYQDEHGNRITATGFDAKNWLDSGFFTSAFENVAERIPVGMQHRATWNDEDGDIDAGRLYGGWDEYMLGMEERPSKPGIRIQFGFCFNAGVNNAIIAQYGAWIMSLISGMETAGFDMTVDANIAVGDLFTNERAVTTNTLLRIKNVGEVSDPVEFSALFSPAGFRVLGFTALCLAGDKLGYTCRSTLGYPRTGARWDLKYDAEEAIVTIMCDGGASVFPAEILTRKAIEAGLLPKDNVEEYDEL